MKFDIARQPLVPAFLTLAALAVVAMWNAGGPAVSTAVQAGHAAETVDIGRNAAGALAVSSPGELLAQFQAAHPVWARWIAGLLMLFTGMSIGRLTVRYNLYSVGTCLAIPLYEQWQLLKTNLKAVLLGITAGVLTSLCTVFVLAKILHLSHKEYVTLLPKSITTAIGMGVSEELGGYVTITVAVIVVTGVLGNIFGELICKIFRITHPIAKGLALGSSSHAIGTAKAMELGEIEGAMSSLAIAVTGIMTVLLASLFSPLL